MSVRRKTGPGMLVSHVLVWLYAALLALPLYYLLVSSLKDNTEIFSSAFGLPSKWLWQNYRDAWEFVSLGPRCSTPRSSPARPRS
ncbi:hypothetical protein Pflav_028870 [Phytohabitans flavus]|uniref:ABC transmembrane type-1 domain-containing protein n=1 Tax=Phytohabitans flavus TaxID=1076124 RepID=A0A6F8XRP1_9ACTN|nr:hypothetical protein [Phytohabitans flavus]BCB76477.1 hypothetical protein Pflav_028870 [Phytohabitans flavus]